MQQMMDLGNYNPTFDDYYHIMDLEEVAVLPKLIRLSEMKRKRLFKRGRSFSGWVLCTTEYLEKGLHISERAQRRILQSLEARGFISIQRKGMPARRYVRVNIKVLIRRLAELGQS